MSKTVRKTNANPAIQRPFCASEWFVESPDPARKKYIPRGGNQVKLLNCGDEYLLELYEAIKKAKKSIYIAIWGFNPHVSLVLNSTDKKHEIGNVLQQRAKEGIEVKILVWHDWVANTFSASGENSLHIPVFFPGWNQNAMMRKFKNVEFVTRNPGGTALSPETRKELERLDNEIKTFWKRHQKYNMTEVPMSSNTMFGGPVLQLNQEAYAKYRALKKKRKELRNVGYGAHKAQNTRKEKGFPYGTIGKFPTHHQKTVLIDHGVAGDEVGFVQGFNFWPQYFDESTHPYRGKNNRIQDVGMRLQGSCLIDIYNNFAQSWNEEKGGTPIPMQAPAIASRGVGGYTCQILRTWRMQDEFNINAFYEKAFTKLNQFIFVEDQYFRQPEFARAINERAKQIRQKAGGKKQLYVFAVTNLNETAVGEIQVREGMLKELNRSDLKASEAEFKKQQEDAREQEKIKSQMEKAGVMVHVCRLRNYKVFDPRNKPGGHRGRGWKPIRYGDVYVHSKLSIFDDAYLTLGSANWNHRSMFTDTELNIAMQSHDLAAADFRKKIWATHTKGLWLDKNKDNSPTKPKQWYKRWDQLLRENFNAYSKSAPLIMNLFPYYEDIDVVREKGVILEMKQKAT